MSALIAAQFDGTALYEHADPREGFHQDWHTLIYNYGRNEVAAYLIGSALEWIERFHIDGLRVDAVASMLYRDYSRQEGQWVPNRDGGRDFAHWGTTSTGRPSGSGLSAGASLASTMNTSRSRLPRL